MRMILMTLFSVLIMSGSVYAREKLVLTTLDSHLNAVVGVNILREAYQRIGIQIETKILPAERALHMANKGKFDGEVIRIREVQELYPNLRRVPVPVIAMEGVVFTKDVTFDVTGWESLKPYTIGILIGSKFIEKGTRGLTVEAVPTYKQVLLKLNAGRTDVAVMARTNGLIELRKLNMKGIRVLEPPLVKARLYHYLHKKNEHLIPQIAQVLKNMVEEGRPKEIWDQSIAESGRR
ncbi:substrate-binding periplasmic protein [Desulfonema magnum]|uniref:Solute-binding protein family 3 domain-containing protein, MltF-like n=1 Tax=Desulfonema magnum TaxID=45655 RepID=A0A975GKX6_9BACT|nr:transporter substrate-binding domain-containing protein [Desulfonema magnum]QTA85079.1 Solute-binding protein family 3 domain-containing protein, MltF-like [Desulfonema magnum]